MAPLPIIDANQLLDWVRWRLHLRTDRLLSQALGIQQPTVSKLRSGKAAIGPSLWVRILDQTGVKLRDLPSLVAELSDRPPGRLPRRRR